MSWFMKESPHKLGRISSPQKYPIHNLDAFFIFSFIAQRGPKSVRRKKEKWKTAEEGRIAFAYLPSSKLTQLAGESQCFDRRYIQIHDALLITGFWAHLVSKEGRELTRHEEKQTSHERHEARGKRKQHVHGSEKRLYLRGKYY